MEAIFSLIGVLFGGIITFLTTYLTDLKNRRYDKKQKEKILICNIIKQYEMLREKIWFNQYYNDDPMDIVKYISNEFYEVRKSNREKELLYINSELLQTIEKTDNLIFPFDSSYSSKEYQNIKKSIMESIEVLRKFID